MPTDPVITVNEEFCEPHFSANTESLKTGGYSVRLPQIENLSSSSLGESYQHAFHRFQNVEKKLLRFPEIKSQYDAFMNEYVSLSRMSLILSQVAQKQYFLHHHGVQNLDSTSTKLEHLPTRLASLRMLDKKQCNISAKIITMLMDFMLVSAKCLIKATNIIAIM